MPSLFAHATNLVFRCMPQDKPGQPHDYAAERKRNDRKPPRPPKGVTVRLGELDGLSAEFIQKSSSQKGTIFYIHGGGFTVGSARERRAICQYITAKYGYNCASFNYRLAPENLWPAPLEDCLTAYYHPTEVVSDKIPALLTFFPEIALHITRPVRWDSDHVVLFDDETKEICKEIVRCGGLDGRVHMALDYFDASINRIAAWVTGFRNVQKALLNALLTPDMTAEQDAGNFTDLLVRQEELKTMPFGEVWAEYCCRSGVPEDGAWLPEVRKYEETVLEARV